MGKNRLRDILKTYRTAVLVCVLIMAVPDGFLMYWKAIYPTAYVRQEMDFGSLGLNAYRRGDYFDASQSFEKAITQKSQPEEVWNDLGNCYFKLGKYWEASNAYQMAVSLNPYDKAAKAGFDSAKKRVMESFETPAANRKEAIQLSPSPIQTPSEHPPYALNSAQLSWGKTQLEHMLIDRPKMAEYVREGDRVWEWTVRQFAGEWAQGGVEWDPADPVPLWDARYYCAWNGRKAHVQVTARSTLKSFHLNQPKEGQELWYELVFEMSNFQVLAQKEEFNRALNAGKISEEEYCFSKYFSEAVETRKVVHDFFMGLWIPNCKKLSLDPWGEFMKMTNNVEIPVWSPNGFFEKYFSLDYSKSAKGNPFEEDFKFHHKFYRDQFEQDIIPGLVKNGVPTPAPVTISELKQRLEVDFPKAISPKISQDDLKAMEEIPPPP